jgi:hypothetical protein
MSSKKILILVLGLAGILLAQSNIVTITEETGEAVSNYPIQIARPFLRGEIPNFPQVKVDGTPVTTQADIKQRYWDGSVKHAVICFLIPSLSANSTVQVTFQNQSTGNNTGALDRTGMLDNAFNFDAVMELTNGSTQTASARTMLNDNAFTYWLQGSVATSVILADHSLARTYDIGFDSNRSIRPIFLATFWPTINKVRIRFIAEISNTEAFQDQSYSVILKTGNTSPTTAFTQSTLTHYAATRWTKEYWTGGEPPTISIDHNVAYLAKTRFIINFDTTKSVSESAVASAYSGWASEKNLFDSGSWQRAMGTAGGRPDIGPYPTWTVRWLFTGDYRMKKKAFINADLAAAWPMHFREGNSTKLFLRGDTLSGVGRVISISSRPTVMLSDIPYTYTEVEDRVVPVGSYSSGGWRPDNAHQPDPYSPQYTLSGDFWYLEQLYFWASWSTAKSNGAAYMYSYGRGPTGAEGGISDQMRGQAWSFRSRVQTTFLAPDNTPEKRYFTQLTEDVIAYWEGEHELTGTAFENNACWTWANEKRVPSIGVPPLNHWIKGSSAFVQSGIDPSRTSEATSTWEQNFMMYALGRAQELGFAVDALVSYLAVNIIGQLTHPDFNPYLIAAYRIPTVRSDGQYFDSWANLLTGYTASAQTTSSFSLSGPDHGYDFIGMAAAAQCANEPGGDSAWAFVKREILPAPVLDNNPKWAILPRDPNDPAVVETAAGEKDGYGIEVFPNPLNPNVNIRIQGKLQNAKCKMQIYNAQGKLVKELTADSRQLRAGITWDASRHPCGFYFIKLKAGNKTLIKKLILLR